MTSIDWDFWTRQREALAAGTNFMYADEFPELVAEEYDIVTFRGGNRSGKTYCGSGWILILALKYESSRWFILSQNFQRGKSTTFSEFFELLPGENTDPYAGGQAENSPLVSDFNVNDKRLRLINGSVIYLAGADSAHRFEGASINGAWLDEVALYDDLTGVMDVLAKRLDRGPPETMMWTGTPFTGNAYEDIVIDGVDADGQPVGLDIYDVQASVVDNPWLSESQLERVKNRFKGTKKEGMVLHGEFTDPDGLVFPEFTDSNLVDDDIDSRLIPGWCAYVYDYGFGDPRVVLYVRVTDAGEMIVLDEFYRSEEMTEQAISWMDARPGTGVVISDHSPEDIERFTQAGYPAVPAEKDRDTGVEQVRRWLRDNDLRIHQRCSETIDEIEKYEQEEFKQAKGKDHSMDCLRYLILGVERGQISPPENVVSGKDESGAVDSVDLTGSSKPGYEDYPGGGPV